MKEYVMMWKRAFDFAVRSRRREFWIPWLINNLIGVFLWSRIFSAVFGTGGGGTFFFYTIVILGLALIIPSIALSVRRLHDIGYSGAWLLIWFLPFGLIVILIFHIMDGTPGPNRYGEDPKGRKPFIPPTA